MSHPYTPVSTVLGATVTLPDDGDASVVASVNVPFQALADAIAFLSAGLTLKMTSFTANGTFTAPANCDLVLLIGCGGGGGGGAGYQGANLAVYHMPGGGGGGGAAASAIGVTVVPGTSYAVTIGAGGAGPTQSGAPSDGGPGDDTTFGSTLAVFEGASGGKSPSIASVIETGTYNVYVYVAQGSPDRSDNCSQKYAVVDVDASALIIPTYRPRLGPGFGGWGASRGSGTQGSRGVAGIGGSFAGGAAGTKGADSGTYRGGGGGGGGGAGPLGVGGAAGGGGAANGAGTGTAGTNGTAGAANTGAGGGGGGAGGGGTGTSNGGNGGAGGSGFLMVVYASFA